jgi:hypothetical protein
MERLTGNLARTKVVAQRAAADLKRLREKTIETKDCIGQSATLGLLVEHAANSLIDRILNEVHTPDPGEASGKMSAIASECSAQLNDTFMGLLEGDAD